MALGGCSGLSLNTAMRRMPSHEPAKGYLPLAEEIRAIELAHAGADARIGVCINWGRSAIETRDVSGPSSSRSACITARNASRGDVLGLFF